MSWDKAAVEQAYAFFHQKLKVYEHSTSEKEKDHIEDTISAYSNAMSPALYASLSGGVNEYLREHSRFREDIQDAVLKMELILGI